MFRDGGARSLSGSADPLRQFSGEATARTKRDPAIDAFRFVAFIAVVLIHTIDKGHYVVPGSPEALDSRLSIDAGQVVDQIARFAVPFFFTASGYFFARRHETSVPASLRFIASRIVPVYVVWTVAFNLPDPVAREAMLQPAFWSRLVLQGGVAPHLWFLPSLAVCLCLLVLCNRVMAAPYQFVLAGALFLLGLMCGPYFQLCFGRQPSILQLHAVRDTATFGFIFVVSGFWFARSGWRPTLVTAVSIFALGGCVYFVEALALVALRSHGLNYNEVLLGTVPFGLGAFLVARTWPPTWWVPRWVSALGVYGLGLYMVHPFFIRLLTPAARLPTLAERSLIATGTVAFSVAAVLALSRVPRLRKFLV